MYRVLWLSYAGESYAAAVLAATPLWVPLVVAALGVIGTVAGTLGGVRFTQQRADERERTAWERTHQREQEQWARDDANRTFENRRDAYLDFYESLQALSVTIYNHGLGLTDDEGELEGEWQLPTFRKLQHLRIYAVPSVAETAETAYNTLWRWGNTTEYNHGFTNDFSEKQEAYDDAEDALLKTIRDDLGIPDD